MGTRIKGISKLSNAPIGLIVPFVGTGIKAAILGFLNKKIQIVPFTGTGIKTEE